MNTIWHIPNNKSFESPKSVLKLLNDYSINGTIVHSELPNHTAIAVPNHLVERASFAIEYTFGRRT